ncbi:MAG: hypothetical protein IT324_01085 [Anaerolineae bacterium]|nr:hypothetical protein [Anaerolineae bacterium]
MSRVYCPQCGGTRVINGKSPLLVALGVLVLAASVVCLVCACPVPWTGSWNEFIPLDQEDPAAIIAIIFGLLLVWGGTNHWNDVICVQCGHAWQPRRRIEPRSQHRPHHSR